MRLYIDNNLPYRFKLLFTVPFEVQHAKDMGWQDMQNGKLLTRVALDFEAMVTVDKGMRFQNRIEDLGIRVAILDCRSNRFDHLVEFIPDLVMLLPQITPGEFVVIPRPS